MCQTVEIKNLHLHILQSLQWCVENLEYFETVEPSKKHIGSIRTADMRFWIDYFKQYAKDIATSRPPHYRKPMIVKIKFKNIDDAIRYKLIWN